MAQGTECFRVPDGTLRTHPSPDKDQLRALGAHFFFAPLRRCVEAMSLFGIVMCQHKRGTAGVRGGIIFTCCWLRIALYFCCASLYSLNLFTAICLRLMYFVVCLSFHIMATRRRPYYLGSSHDGLRKWASLSPLPVACGYPPPVIFWGGGFRQPLMPQ